MTEISQIRMPHSYAIGITAALAAALVWSMNFVVPFVIDSYSVFDFALLRFVISGGVGVITLAWKWDKARHLVLRDWLVAALLVFIGYVGYFLLVAGSAIYVGPVIAPAILGIVPVVLAIAGNLRQGTVPWRLLAAPLMLVVLGLWLVNRETPANIDYSATPTLLRGMLLAIGAVALWTWFGLANQAALAVRPNMDTGIWTALILIGGGVEMLAFFPVGALLGVFQIPHLGLSWKAAGPLYVWGISLAFLSSVGGTWAWTIAARNLSVALSAQLIVAETGFGAIFGLAVHSRWPTWAEATGLAALIFGVVTAIRIFYRKNG